MIAGQGFDRGAGFRPRTAGAPLPGRGADRRGGSGGGGGSGIGGGESVALIPSYHGPTQRLVRRGWNSARGSRRRFQMTMST